MELSDYLKNKHGQKCLNKKPTLHLFPLYLLAPSVQWRNVSVVLQWAGCRWQLPIVPVQPYFEIFAFCSFFTPGLKLSHRVGATCQVVEANHSSKHMGLIQPSSLQLLCLPFSMQWEAKDVNGMAPAWILS